ncbi:neural cell adhesion molecule 1-like [Saccoglossus kowalevskii]
MMFPISGSVTCVVYSVLVCNLVLAAQHFTVTPTDQSAVVGDTVTFHCTVAEKKGFLTWLQDGSPLNFDTTMSTGNADYSIVYKSTADGEAYDLRITNVGHDDAKNYQCTITQGGGDNGAISEQVSLTVTGTVIWSKDSEDITSDATVTNGDNRFSITGNQNNGEYNLQIVNADTQDAGTYACRVTASGNSVQIGPSQALLTVKELQSFGVEPVSKGILEDSDVTLFCSVSDKAGQLVWSLNGEDISSDSTITTSTSGYTINSPTPSVDYNLKIESVRPEHAGNYVCSVTSANGHPEITSDTALLTVEIPVRVPTCAPSTVNTLILGENLILVCETERDEPAAILRWIQDGGEEQDGITLDTDTEIRVGLVLTITEELQGSVFTCVSTHPTHQNQETCQVGPLAVDILQTEIKLFSKEANRNAKVGEDITMDCTVQNKLGTIHWIRDGQVISSDTTMNNDDTRYFIGGDQSIGEFNLNINSVSKPDAGSYYCLLTSSVEELPVVSSNVMQLNIGDAIPPKDNYPQCAKSSKDLIDGDTVLLTCISKGGDPPAILQWDQDGNNQEGIHIDESALSLQVNISNEINGATFTCTSKHSTFNQSQTCVIGPIQVADASNGDSWNVGFWIVLVFLIIAIIIISFLIVFLVRRKGRKERTSVTI